MHKILTSSTSRIGERLAVPAWKNALHHFQRLLIECGSTMEIEHSQRLGLLFSKNVGCDRDVELWASLFDADGVPATAMMLKALVVHNKWQTALKLLALGADHPNSTELGELLAQDLLKQNLALEAYSVVELLVNCAPPPADEVTQSDVVVRNVSSSSELVSQEAWNDSVGLATDPTYVPRDQRCDMSGIGAAVLRQFPNNSQWEQAVDTLSSVYKHARGGTQLKILECIVARCTYGGRDFGLAQRFASQNVESIHSATIQRCLFYGAVEEARLDDAISALASLSKMGSNQIARHTFLRFCRQALRSRNERDRSLNRRCATLIASNFTLCRGANEEHELHDFVIEFAESPVRENTLARSNDVLADLTRYSITELDRFTSQFVRNGQWEAALGVIHGLSTLTPKNKEEEIVHNAVNEHLSDWQKALLFFS